jgi:endonuclease YncB( thermonuclease family)
MMRVLLLVVLALPRLAESSAADASEQDDRCVVAQFVDGDTFRCGDGRKVRLIGVDTPENGQGEPGRPDVKYAERFGRAQKEARARRAGLWADR